MRKREVTIIAFAVLIVILLLTVCFIQNINSAPSTQSKVINGLQLSLTLGAKTTTYKQGAVISVTVALTNIGHEALNVSFDNSYLGLDVRNSENVSIWTEESPILFDGNETLAPQRSVNDTLIWNTGSYRYTPEASIGVYQIVGFIVTGLTEPNSTRSFQTAPLNITIVKGISPNTSNQQYSSQH